MRIPRTPLFFLGLLLAAPLSTASAQTLSVNNLTEGMTATIEISGCSSGDSVQVAYSLSGPGPISTAYGLVYLTPEVMLDIPAFRANANGVASMDVPIPPNSGGVPVWFHALNISTGALTNPLAEVIVFNNPPVIHSVSPNQGNQGDWLPLVFSGSDFITGSQVQFVGAAQTIAATNVVVGHHTFMTADVDLAGAPAGLYTVLVTVPSGLTGELVDGFEVLAMAPSLSGIAPSSGFENEVISITISGDFIDQGAILTVTQGATSLSVSNLVIAADGTSVTADLDLTAPLGFYDAEVTDPDGTSDALVGAFEIMTLPSGDWVQIPAGTFEMGDHFGVGGSNEGPLHSVTLDAFKMDVYEVTNELYAAYLNDAYAAGSVTVNSNVIYQVGGAGEALADTTASSSYSRITWNGSTFGVTAGKERHPLVEVSWYGACTYANWRSEQQGLTPCYNLSTWACDFNANGWRLPTEAEWEYAARGGAHNPYYKYPWNSNSITSSDANYDRNIGTTCDVGNYAPNGYGLYDTAGNVWEWCNDWYSSSYYSSSPGSNPTGPSSVSYRVIRGGSWLDSAVDLRSADRGASYPNDRYIFIGLRLLSVH
ncbi:MAG: SUMF1/EgtB/PvdO family nonheme iron enzyme [Planctomycetes bacterium]|nr:SUMF1/EgtB/PvdO family nonheme iron enzyme [Planctomycetota bacterium]